MTWSHFIRCAGNVSFSLVFSHDKPAFFLTLQSAAYKAMSHDFFLNHHLEMGPVPPDSLLDADDVHSISPIHALLVDIYSLHSSKHYLIPAILPRLPQANPSHAPPVQNTRPFPPLTSRHHKLLIQSLLSSRLSMLKKTRITGGPAVQALLLWRPRNPSMNGLQRCFTCIFLRVDTYTMSVFDE